MSDEKVHLAEANLKNQIYLLESERDELNKLHESEIGKLKREAVMLTETKETEAREELEQANEVVVKLKTQLATEVKKGEELEQAKEALAKIQV